VGVGIIIGREAGLDRAVEDRCYGMDGGFDGLLIRSEVFLTVGIGGLGRCKVESYSITVGNLDILLLMAKFLLIPPAGTKNVSFLSFFLLFVFSFLGINACTK
jgi:hypothetical protein